MIEGKNIIGYSSTSEGQIVLKAFEAQSQNELPENFIASTSLEVERAARLASEVASDFSRSHPEDRAKFLEAIADEIEALGSLLLERASIESGLPIARLQGERDRTCGQLRLFAQVVREGSWIEATIDSKDPNRAPIPKPDIRKMLMGIGPVLVFTASNFPLAFSTAGGDTASALAAGCPVIVKAHEAHLGTNEMVALAIKNAAKKTQMPEGVFSSLNGDGFKTGEQLVNHPQIKAVAFTGSHRGGMALYQMAQNRKEPIPVFSEMGSINPVVICSGALAEKSEEIAKTYMGSITLGVGQFCTNPGLLIAVSSSNLDTFKVSLSAHLNEVPEATMLTDSIKQSFVDGRKNVLDQLEVKCVTNESSIATLAVTSGRNFISSLILHQEIFGPMSLLVECADEEELLRVIDSLEGQLTGTIMASKNDHEFAREIANSLQKKVGRLIWNGAPTGVEVCYAMHHGGPFPATTDSRFTSVGTSAIKRFARPVCYQDFPEDLLPVALRDSNELNIFRKVDGTWQE